MNVRLSSKELLDGTANIRVQMDRINERPPPVPFGCSLYCRENSSHAFAETFAPMHGYQDKRRARVSYRRSRSAPVLVPFSKTTLLNPLSNNQKRVDPG